MTKHIKAAKLEDVGTLERDDHGIEFPCALDDEAIYVIYRATYQWRIRDARGNTVALVPCITDPTFGDEPYRRERVKAQFILDAINARAA